MLSRSPGSDRADPPALDRSAERRPSGCPEPAGAQPAGAGEARPRAGANAAPGAADPTDQAAATQPLVVVAAPPAAPAVTPARAARTRHRQQLRAVAAVVVGCLAVAGIAGAVSLGKPVRRTAPPDAGIPAPATQGGQEAASADPTPAAADLGAMTELCRAYLADRDAGLDARQLSALAAAAGGAGEVAGWCQAVTATAAPVGRQGQGRRGPPGTRGRGHGHDRPRGPPVDPGGGHPVPPERPR